MQNGVASGVTITNGKLRKISNFQIVNGVQTAASIYAASKTPKSICPK
ncbi:AIPR family protein [Helicobacter bizzozeronii]